ncbi:unnamed protein product [Cyclocybe aegerita]|uniref:Uncharacterized protein n=1 Tax=Cyclocybe aegerita TaxID=1973307 RepID=A0A8S0WU35_CYCAE|nr:unnamed protein product [Cyclocybe aegerita]
MSHQATSGEPDSKKRRKRSAITGGELIALYETLQRVRQRITEMAQVGEDGDGDPEQEDLFTIDPAAQKLDEVLKMLEPKVHGRPVRQITSYPHEVFPLSSIQQDEIDTLNVREGQTLELRDDPARLNLEQERGANERGRTMYSIAISTKASARTWIDAIFFRAMAMLSSSLVEQRKQLVLGLKLSVSTTVGQAVLKGFIDYTILKAGKTPAASFLRAPQLSKLAKESDPALFVAEAKAVGVPLGQQVPQALGEMYACAGALKKSIIRGALTDGRVWIFLLLKLNADEPGATYHVSHEVSIMGAGPLFRPQVDPKACAIIAAILAYWIEHSFEDIGDEDWFKFTSQ